MSVQALVICASTFQNVMKGKGFFPELKYLLAGMGETKNEGQKHRLEYVNCEHRLKTAGDLIQFNSPCPNKSLATDIIDLNPNLCQCLPWHRHH